MFSYIRTAHVLCIDEWCIHNVDSVYFVVCGMRMCKSISFSHLFVVYIILRLFSSINPVEDICNFRLTGPFLSHRHLPLSHTHTNTIQILIFSLFSHSHSCIHSHAVTVCENICVNYISFACNALSQAFSMTTIRTNTHNVCISICLQHTLLLFFRDVNRIIVHTSHSFFYTTSHTNCLENECRFLCFYIRTVQYKCYCSSTLLHSVLSL